MAAYPPDFPPAAPEQPARERWGGSSTEQVPYIPPYTSPQSPPQAQPQARQGRRSRWPLWLGGGCLAALMLSLLACVVVVGIVSAFIYRVVHEVPVSETSTQTLAVSGTPTLNIQNPTGDVHVVTGATGAVELSITRTAHASTSDAAQTDLNNIKVSVTQTGSTIQVVAQTGSVGGVGLGLGRSVDIVATVPPHANIQATVQTGDISLTGVSGVFAVEVTTGDVSAQGITFADGSQVRVTTGDATLAGTLAPAAALQVDVTTGDAELDLPATTAATVDAQVTTGNVTVHGWQLTTTRSGISATAQGAIGTASTGTGTPGTITIRVGTGNITIGQQ